jgi:hypothetical protein
MGNILFLPRMKRILSILVTVLLTITASAQMESRVEELPALRTIAPTMEFNSDLKSRVDALPMDTLHLPLLNNYGQVPINMYPYNFWGGYHSWNLHEGLNMNLGASVFGSWGGSRYLGTGFSQDFSLMYAVPLSNRLSLAVGGYFNNTFFAHDTYRDAGISAVLGYRFNEHWEAYLYGQKSLVKNHLPMPLYYGMGYVGDRIGAAVKYNVNPTMSFQVNVELMETPAFPAHYYMMRPSRMEPSSHGAPPPPAP